MSPDTLDASEREVRQRLYNRMLDLLRVNPDDPRCNKFVYLSDLELRECALEEHDHDRLDAIPEAFLWHVFDQLVNAALVMHRGAELLLGERPWREIVHKDLHLGNILLKPAEQSSDGSKPRPDRPSKSRNGFFQFSKDEVSVFTRS
jgi:hypothetical protein